MGAWNGWYHVNFSTYGTWLPGDERGWRSRHHRIHVEGDYRNRPPAERHAALRARSRQMMRGPAVFLSDDEKRIAGQALVEMLADQGVEVLALSLDAVHCHVLSRFGPLAARAAVGRAKKHAYHEMRQQAGTGRIWGLRCRVGPVGSRDHQLNVYRYIVSHGEKGAWVWTFRDGTSEIELPGRAGDS